MSVQLVKFDISDKKNIELKECMSRPEQTDLNPCICPRLVQRYVGYHVKAEIL